MSMVLFIRPDWEHDLMSRECQYTKDDQYNDQQCVGCSHHINKAGAHHEKV